MIFLIYIIYYQDAEEGKEEAADQTELEQESEVFVLDDFFGGGDLVGEASVEGGAGGTEAGTEEEGAGRAGPGGEGETAQGKADVGGFGDVAAEVGGGRLWGGWIRGRVARAVWGVFHGCGSEEAEAELVYDLAGAGGEGVGGGGEGGHGTLSGEAYHK